jgi:hypothetical protein
MYGPEASETLAGLDIAEADERRHVMHLSKWIVGDWQHRASASSGSRFLTTAN